MANRCHRRGSVYSIALASSLIIVCLSLASIHAVRVNRRLNNATSELTHARLLAQAGIEAAKTQITGNSSWRTAYDNNLAYVRSVNNGNVSVTMSDPIDNSLKNKATDPVVVTSTGTFGSAKRKLSAYFEPQQRIFAACRSALYSNTLIQFQNSTVTANHWAISGDKIKTSGTNNLNLNCYGYNAVEGSGYAQRTVTGGRWPIDQLDFSIVSPLYVASYYLNNGVTINASQLPTRGTELLSNAGFESGFNNWSVSGFCIPIANFLTKVDGTRSYYITARDDTTSGPSQDVTSQILKGRSYLLSFWIRPDQDQTFNPVLQLQSSGGGSVAIVGTGTAAKAGTWTKVQATLIPQWIGELQNATWQIQSSKSTAYSIDAASFTNDSRLAATRYVENLVLSDTVNPISGSLSTQAIYIINTPNEDLVIRDCRIGATLVVSAAKSVTLDGALLWEPRGTNFPALISLASLSDSTDSPTLNEADTGVNYNPPGFPYAGTSNVTQQETYPAIIRGPVVSSAGIDLSGKQSYVGFVYANSDLNVRAPTLNISYPSDLIMNPPPGFCTTVPDLRYLGSSLQTLP